MITEMEVKVMSPEETDRLAELEAAVRKDLKGFLRVGMALKEIRDQKLFRGKAVTWEDYLKQVWDFSKAYGNRYIAAYNVVENIVITQAKLVNTDKTAPMGAVSENAKMTPMGVILDDEEKPSSDVVLKESAMPSWAQETLLPQNERQARPLTLLSPEQQTAVWQRVLLETGGKPTALAVRKRVEEILDAQLDETKEGIQKRVTKDVSIPEDFSQQFAKLLEILSMYRKSGWKEFNRKQALDYVKAIEDFLK
ncbi:MAG: hypothetical protein K9K21_02945 [Desulfotignum sp.]|nr:hypothetical protein [Desulfotignum sp.]